MAPPRPDSPHRNRSDGHAPRRLGDHAVRPEHRGSHTLGKVYISVKVRDICSASEPVAVVGRYVNVPAEGAMKGFDTQLRGWLKTAIDRGVIASPLGELAFVPIPSYVRREPGPDPELLIIAGMGEVSRFTRDDLSYLFSNVSLAVALLGHKSFATTLIGNGGDAIPRARCVRAIVDGIRSSFSHFPTNDKNTAVDEGVIASERPAYDEPPDEFTQPVMRVALYVRSNAAAHEVWREVKRIAGDLNGRGERIDDDEPEHSNLRSVERRRREAESFSILDDPDRDTESCLVIPVACKLAQRESATTLTEPRSRWQRSPNRVTITKQPPPKSAGASVTAATSSGNPAALAPLSVDPSKVTLEYSALTTSAVVPVRRVEVQAYFVARFPEQLQQTMRVADQNKMGELLARYLMPNDIRLLVQGDESLVLILDADTAAVPWEMGAYKAIDGIRFHGIDSSLTRQFRSTAAATPGMTPPLNKRLDVLIIADPAPIPYGLPEAQAEALAVIAALNEMRIDWAAHGVQIKVTLRIGSAPASPAELAKLEQLEKDYPEGFFTGTPQPCDPLDVLGLTLNDQFDVVHFAGHGAYDRDTQRGGWIFGKDCMLTPNDVLRIGSVPRLVFANACHSARLGSSQDESNPQQMASLAEAFFVQGIENYLGTGWEVDTELAAVFASEFYKAALGKDEDWQPLAKAAARARQRVREIEIERSRDADEATLTGTWGAYQYYGQPNVRLMDFG